MFNRIDCKELAFGVFLIALASLAFMATSALEFGTAADMGPGFVPRILASAIMCFGAVFCITSVFKAPQAITDIAWRPLLSILASAAVFAVLFSRLGLILACIGALLTAGTAVSPVRWGRLLLFGPLLAAFSALLFVKGIGLPLMLWPPSWAQWWNHLW